MRPERASTVRMPNLVWMVGWPDGRAGGELVGEVRADLRQRRRVALAAGEQLPQRGGVRRLARLEVVDREQGVRDRALRAGQALDVLFVRGDILAQSGQFVLTQKHILKLSVGGHLALLFLMNRFCSIILITGQFSACGRDRILSLWRTGFFLSCGQNAVCGKQDIDAVGASNPLMPADDQPLPLQCCQRGFHRHITFAHYGGKVSDGQAEIKIPALSWNVLRFVRA